MNLSQWLFSVIHHLVCTVNLVNKLTLRSGHEKCLIDCFNIVLTGRLVHCAKYGHFQWVIKFGKFWQKTSHVNDQVFPLISFWVYSNPSLETYQQVCRLVQRGPFIHREIRHTFHFACRSIKHDVKREKMMKFFLTAIGRYVCGLPNHLPYPEKLTDLEHGGLCSLFSYHVCPVNFMAIERAKPKILTEELTTCWWLHSSTSKISCLMRRQKQITWKTERSPRR